MSLPQEGSVRSRGDARLRLSLPPALAKHGWPCQTTIQLGTESTERDDEQSSKSTLSRSRRGVSDVRPLAALSERLRARPGRPKKLQSDGLPDQRSTVAADAALIHGGLRGAARDVLGNVPVATLTPRLLGLEAAAAYLGVTGWTVRALEAAGTIRRVRIPLGGDRELRKLLFDRLELDKHVERWKE